jgi:SAM-dependent methyltransferase
MDEEGRERVMRDYYERRAPLLDRAYREAGGPSGWMLAMVADLQAAFRGRRVLEVACGTGHWTVLAAEAASYVVGTDISPAMLALARVQELPAERAVFLEADAYDLAAVPGDFDAGLAMQWFSHIPRARYDDFLDGLHRRLGAGAVIFLGDNQAYEGMRDQPYALPGAADTYELRALPDGSRYEIVKNYFSEDDLRAIFAPRASELQVVMGTYWWWLWYTVR